MIPSPSKRLGRVVITLSIGALGLGSVGCPAPGGYGRSAIEPNVEKLKQSEDPCDQVVVEVCKQFPECGLWRAAFEYGEQMAASKATTTCHDLLANGPAMKEHVKLAKSLVANASFATEWPKDGVFLTACDRLLQQVCSGVSDCAPFRKMFNDGQREAGDAAEATCRESVADPQMVKKLQNAARMLSSGAK